MLNEILTIDLKQREKIVKDHIENKQTRLE